ncbi:hypothetical protein ACQR22_02550 [Clostridium perfringens]|uniref:hypothetical protein n=1 Tax=Clostridium perfringens TaxID=1502 RepID=UPI001F5AECD0|nr:hypothetical protein [Clostridium perfringens]MCI2778924.1 hypothetical protein [Clostridium perfringens]
MVNSNDKMILDSKLGNVISKDGRDKVILLGSYYQSGSNFVENIEIVINSENDKKSIVTKVNYTAYNLELFLGDFDKDGLDEIMLRGAYGGSGGYEIASVYKYKNGSLEEIFSPEIFENKYTFKAKYLPRNLVEVISPQLEEKFIFHMNNKPKTYLDMIYEENGEVRKGVTPVISSINEAFPIKTVYSKENYLFIRQRVVGVSNADTIGYIESFISLEDDNITILNIGAFNFGEKYNKNLGEEVLGERGGFLKEDSSYPQWDDDYFKGDELKEKSSIDLSGVRCIKTMESSFIDFYKTYEEEFSLNREVNLIQNSKIIENRRESKFSRSQKKNNIPLNIANKFPIETEFLTLENLEHSNLLRIVDEGKESILIPYLLDKTPYLALLNKDYESYMLKHNFRGEGLTIKDLFILNLGKEVLVFIGFQVDTKLNKLHILKVKDGRLVKAFNENEYYYSKVFLENLNSDKEAELIIWINEIEEAYKIEIYSVKESGLKKTNKLDKYYYGKVVDYYKNLIENYGNKSIYSYYLALAYEKVREYRKAIAIIDDALEEEFPYPSVEKLKELRKNLKKLIK